MVAGFTKIFEEKFSPECVSLLRVSSHGSSGGAVLFYNVKENLEGSNGIKSNLEMMAVLFETIEAQKKEFNVLDYCISQTTMDDVFLNFAEKQERELVVQTK